MWCVLGGLMVAQAQEEDDEIDIGNQTGQPTTPDWTQPKSKSLGDVDDDPTMRDFAAEDRKKAPPAGKWHVDPTGKQPLADAFDIQVVAYTDQLVLAELPVMVAADRASFLAAHPGGMVLMAEVTSGKTKRVVIEHLTPESIYETGPTLVFLKVAVPNPAQSDSLRFLVKTQELPAPPPVLEPGAKPPAKPPAPPPPAPIQDRFARTTVYLRAK